jgi:tryptophan halogenase
VLATSNGWSSASASAARGGEGIPIAQGRLAEPWVRNCVAIGDAAVSVEPLEWTNLHLAHSQIDRMVSMMPGKDCAPVELAEYNRQCNAEADRVRDFLIMHYVTARREEPFWIDAASVELPPSLQHSLSLFAERGRLPYYEEETFTRDSWLAVLFGQGSMPRRVDPLAFSIPDEQVEETLTNCRQSIAAFVAAQPSYREFVSQMGQHARA